MGIEEQMTSNQKIAQIEAKYNAQIEQLEKQKEQLRAERDQFIAQIILEESDLSEIDDIDFLYDLSSITYESASKLLNNADIIKLRYYLKYAIILLEHGNYIDRDRLLEKTRSAAYAKLNDPDDFVNILTHKIEYKSVEEIVIMIKQIILAARQKQENHGQLTK